MLIEPTSSRPLPRGFRALLAATLVLPAATALPGVTAQPAAAQALFAAAEVMPQRFVLVAAPIGSGPRAQLNIYEQVNDRRACFAVGEGRPAAVNPLLSTFDFTGICSRYIDAHGYSLRIGGSDLATSYRLLVRNSGSDALLVALPTKSGAGPEMVVARAGGKANGFLKLELEPGWRLMRRQFRGRNLGHLYVYADSLPSQVGQAGAAIAPAAPNAAVAAPAVPAPPVLLAAPSQPR